MINILTSLMIFFVSIECYFLTTNFTGVDEAFKSTFRSVYEMALVTINNDDKPYFDKYIMKNILMENLALNLKNYTKEYGVTIYYYHEWDYSPCDESVCYALQVRLETKIQGYVRYNRALSAVVTERI